MGGDPIGALLVRSGVLSEESVQEILERQQQAIPFASLCWIFGYAEEESLAAALADHYGIEALVLERSVFELDTFARLAESHALVEQVLPIGEDDHAVYVAVDRPADVRDALMDIEYLCGKPAVARVAVAAILTRTARACLAALARGERTYVGPLAIGRQPHFHIVTPTSATVSSTAPSAPSGTMRAPAPHERRAHGLLFDDVTNDVGFDDPLVFDDITAASALGGSQALAEAFASGTRRIDRRKTTSGQGTHAESTAGSMTTRGADESSAAYTPVAQSPAEMGENTQQVVLELDSSIGPEYRTEHGGSARIVVVDDDFASRQLLGKELGSLGYELICVATAGEAMDAIRLQPPDIVVADVMLPDMGGFQLCRAIKESKKYGRVGVVLMSAVIDSGRVSDEVLTLYGADDYVEKPLNMKRLKRRLRQLLVERGAAPQVADQSFQRALALYRGGEVTQAVDELRRGLTADPLSAKHHFVLANLLQKQQLISEAIDEYEAVLDLKPDYFPALTRLAYLYYKKGHSAKAVDTWRRALPVCPDASLRENIEGFMRKLIAELGQG